MGGFFDYNRELRPYTNDIDLGGDRLWPSGRLKPAQKPRYRYRAFHRDRLLYVGMMGRKYPFLVSGEDHVSQHDGKRYIGTRGGLFEVAP
jgi:hypothetical protein